jgi:hypothetical protein
MITLLEVESAIQQLPENDARSLAQWLQEYLDDRWDRQMEEDLESGKLDRLLASSEADIVRKNVKNLDEVLMQG